MGNIEKKLCNFEKGVCQKEITPLQKEMPEFEDYKQNTDELEDIRKQLCQVKKTIEEPEKLLLGDFKDGELNINGKIGLSEGDEKRTVLEIKKIKLKHRFSLPSLFAGSKTATEYDSKADNFSTRTDIITLEDGRKIFAVYNYPMSWIHRSLDGISKYLAGDKMAKASSSDWKKTFESRSNIPIIECKDENVVLMPFIQNINAYDLFARNKEIEDFGQCEFAKDIGFDGKMQVAEKIIVELRAIHQKGKTWGETPLTNIIVTPEGNPIIVDPETQYYKDVPIVEQKARDIKDVVMSVCGALKYSEKINDYKPVVDRLLFQYADKEVVEELKKVISKKTTRIEKFVMFLYGVARLRINMVEYQKVTDAILAYSR